MKKFLKLAAITFFVSVPLPVLTSLGYAQSAGMACGKTAEVLKAVTGKYKEVPVGNGLTPSGNMVSVFASEGGTFTIVISTPNGTSCMPAVGDSWVSEPGPKKGRAS